MRRKELGLTAEKLAEKVDINRTYISKIERHDFLPSAAVLTRIISVLKDNPNKYIRLYKARSMKAWQRKIKPLSEKF